MVAGPLPLSRSLLTLGRRKLHGPQSSAIALGGDHSVLLRGGHGDGCRDEFLSLIRPDVDTFDP
jgi:hypothetical protein